MVSEVINEIANSKSCHVEWLIIQEQFAAAAAALFVVKLLPRSESASSSLHNTGHRRRMSSSQYNYKEGTLFKPCVNYGKMWIKSK